MVAAILGQAAALMLSLALVAALHLDPIAAIAPIYLPLLVILVAFSQRWILAYSVHRTGLWLVANVVSLLALIPLVWSFQRCLGMTCAIDLIQMSTLILVGASISLTQWTWFVRRTRMTLVCAGVAGVCCTGLGIWAAPQLSDLAELVAIGLVPTIIAGLWTAGLFVRSGHRILSDT